MRGISRSMAVAAAALMTASLAACGAAGEQSGASEPVTAESIQGEWTLTAGKVGDVELKGSTAAPIVLNIDAEGLHANSGCNQMNGTIEVGADGDITVGPMARTMMFCEGLMETEDAYAKGLGAVDHGELRSGGLVLTGADVEMSFGK